MRILLVYFNASMLSMKVQYHYALFTVVHSGILKTFLFMWHDRFQIPKSTWNSNLASTLLRMDDHKAHEKIRGCIQHIMYRVQCFQFQFRLDDVDIDHTIARTFRFSQTKLLTWFGVYVHIRRQTSHYVQRYKENRNRRVRILKSHN